MRPPDAARPAREPARAQRALLNPGHHPTAEGFRSAIGGFFRAVRFGLDVHAYLARRAMA